MNVFEDLVVELKQENLLEDTVIDTERAAAEADASLDITDEPNPHSASSKSEGEADASGGEILHDEGTVSEAAFADDAIDTPPVAAKKRNSGREFYHKRAVAEVSSLQMVEHVLTGVEREYLKIVPKSFDDFNAKKALNAFLQMPGDAAAEEHKSAEFDLMQETETWASALAERDRDIAVSALRHFCENARPALSSQALLALGRFYRNSAYTEAVRAKFDFVMTRLFSRPGPGEGRTLLFSRQETLEHITRLYADWSSVPLYTAEADESHVLLTALSFDDLATEAENASTFDQLIKSDFFNRLRTFKESISDLFYAPNVTSAAIEGNIRIGNAYVRLIESAHKKLDAGSIQQKYGEANEQAVSDAAGWTLDLAEIIRQRAETPAEEKPPAEAERDEPTEAPRPNKPAGVAGKGTSVVGTLKAQFKAVNKWVVVLSALLLVFGGGLWYWANYYANEEVPTTNVRGIPLESTPLAEHLKTAKVSGDTMYGLLLPSWDVLSKDKRTEFLQKCLAAAQQNGAKQVQLFDRSGKQAGYASSTRIDVPMP